MDHNLEIVAILTIGFALASFFAYLMQCLKLPTILGYLLAGFIIGPFSPGYVADITIAEQLAEIGVILMLFGVGLHFKLEDLLSVTKTAIPGAAGQTFATALFATLFTYGAGWTLESGIIMGLSIGVASTVVLIRVLQDHQLTHTEEGRIAIGWLIVEDIFTVIILILLPMLAAFMNDGGLSYVELALTLGAVFIKLSILMLFMFTWGHKIVGWILNTIVRLRLRSQELFTLTVLAIVFIIATGSSIIFGTSIALGAFIAGMVIGKTTVRHQAATNALPLKDIFAIIFFISVGMLFNPRAIYDNFYVFAGIISIILIVKPLSAYLLTLTLGRSIKVALTVAISLAQIGEFSFILAEEAMRLDLLPEAGFDIVVASALISISINPLLFQLISPLDNFLKRFFYSKKTYGATKKEKSSLPNVVIIGMGSIGKEVSEILKNLGFHPTAIETNIDTVSHLEKKDSIIYGDATDESILNEAHILNASHLIITIPETTKTLEIINTAQKLKPSLIIIARVQYLEERYLMERLHVRYVCSEKETLSAFVILVRKSFPNYKSPFGNN